MLQSQLSVLGQISVLCQNSETSSSSSPVFGLGCQGASIARQGGKNAAGEPLFTFYPQKNPTHHTWQAYIFTYSLPHSIGCVFVAVVLQVSHDWMPIWESQCPSWLDSVSQLRLGTDMHFLALDTRGILPIFTDVLQSPVTCGSADEAEAVRSCFCFCRVARSDKCHLTHQSDVSDAARRNINLATICIHTSAALHPTQEMKKNPDILITARRCLFVVYLK